jgi:4-amino-4-deoxy-L-arabinose transferase-like glycosyltransferase
MLRRLDLPATPSVLLLTVLGSPLVYYTALEPGYKHAVGTLAITLTAYLLLLATERDGPDWKLLLALGAAFAFAVTIRYADVAMLPGILLPFLVRRRPREASAVLGAIVLAGVVLFLLPAARGIPYKSFGTSQGVRVEAAAARAPGPTAAQPLPLGLVPFYDRVCPPRPIRLNLEQCLRNRFDAQFDLRVPAKMLFSLQRGLFLWTPLTLLASVGFALLLRSRRDRRPYLWGLAVSALCLLAVHVAWDIHWTGGFSFSQRFLTELFPLFLIGTAELVRRWGRIAIVVLGLCCAWSLVLALTIFYGYPGQTAEDGLRTIAPLLADGTRTPWGLVHTAAAHAAARVGV